MRTRRVNLTGTTIMAAIAGMAVTLGMLMWSADPALAAGPALRIVPAPAQAGTSVKAFGQGFCGRATCASIDIVLAGNTVATGRPASDGTFQLTFTIRAAPGQYAVTATQSNPGQRLQASTGLLVLPPDNRTPPPTTKLVPPATKPPVTPPATTTPPHTTSQPPTPTPTGTPTPSTTPPSPPSTTTPAPPTAAGTTTATVQSPQTNGSTLPWILGSTVLVAGAGTASVLWWRRRTP